MQEVHIPTLLIEILNANISLGQRHPPPFLEGWEGVI